MLPCSRRWLAGGKILLGLAGLMAFCCALFSGSLGAQSREGGDSKASPWMISVEEPALRMIAPRSGVGAGRVYWYLRYTLHNKTDQDHDLFVSVLAHTETGKTYSDLYLPGVERAAERRERRNLWGKSDQVELLAKRDPKDPKYQYFTLKAGERRHCIAVLNDIDPTAGKVKLELSGLSNELRLLTREDGKRVLETRVQELSFERSGDEFGITEDSFRMTRQTWNKKQVLLVASSEN